MKQIEFQKVYTGIFNVMADGQSTDYQILNLDRGISGRGGNVYGILKNSEQKSIRIGSLALAKKTVAKWINK
jgi:hypothetical protein